MNGLFRDICAVVAQIPRGSVATYGQIAAMVGRPRAARAVAWALHTSSDPSLPCHRVVARTGQLAPDHVFGGQELQRQRLEEEGIAFLADGTIRMDRHLWEPQGDRYRG
ncbi:MAG: MGMT family protein [Bacillota bacterium]